MTNRRGVDTKRQVKDLLQTELPKVYRIALDLVQDKRVAPSARAKLISDLFRAAGLYADTDDDRQKEPHEMTAGELEQAIRDLEGKTRPTLFD